MYRRMYLRTLVAGGTVAAGVGTNVSGPSVVQTAQARSDSDWSQQAKLAADDGDGSDLFGTSVAVSDDGTTAVIGAFQDEDPNGEDAGSAYVFGREGGSWSQQAKLTADDGEGAAGDECTGFCSRGDWFGVSVAVSGDGTTAVIGAVRDSNPNGFESGSAYVFSQDGDSWSQQAKLIPDDGVGDHGFGISVAVSDDDTTAVIGAFRDSIGGPQAAGSAYVFSRDGDSWSQQTKLTDDDREELDYIGTSVAVSGDGTTAVIGADNDDNPNGENAGAAYVFSREGGSWSQQAKLTATDGDEADHFGAWVAVSNDGTTAISRTDSEDNPNSVCVFSREGGSWSQQAELTPDEGHGSDGFDGPVAVSGDGTTAMICAGGNDNPNGENAGAAYVFSQDGDSWSQQGKLTADDGDEGDVFGGSVAVSGDGTTAVISAIQDEDPNGEDAGSAYVFASGDGDSPLVAYTNEDGIVDTDGLRDAIGDWRTGEIETSLLRAVINAWRTGDPVA